MNISVKAAMVVGLLLSSLSADASLIVSPTLTVHNKCGSDIIIAVHYEGKFGWTTTSFVSIKANAQEDDVVSSNNSTFFYYAESLSSNPRTRWSGDQNKKVDGKVYPMKKTTLSLDRQRNRYRLQLSCPGGNSEPIKSIGRVRVPSEAAGPARSICEMARDARARNSPAAPNLEAQCRAAAKPPRRNGVTYNSPTIVAANGETVMLDFCRDYGSACGKLAADAFCRQNGHPDASRFQISEDIGYTAIISTGAICDNPICDGFTEIQCNPDP